MRWLLAFVSFGCGGYLFKHAPPVAPDEPVALTGLNTPFDDFNAAKPPNLHDLVYSTNRGSKGEHLDVWSARVLFDREPHVGTPVTFEPTSMSEHQPLQPLQHINSEANDVYVTLPYGERRALFASPERSRALGARFSAERPTLAARAP